MRSDQQFRLLIKRRRNSPVPTEEQLRKCKERTKEDADGILRSYARNQIENRVSGYSKSLVLDLKMLWEGRMRRHLGIDMQQERGRAGVKHMEMFFQPDAPLLSPPPWLGWQVSDWLRLLQYKQCVWKRHNSNTCRHKHPSLCKPPMDDVIPDTKLASSSWRAGIHPRHDPYPRLGVRAPSGTPPTAITETLPPECYSSHSRKLKGCRSGAAEALKSYRHKAARNPGAKFIAIPGGSGKMPRHIQRFRFRSMGDYAARQSRLRLVQNVDDVDVDVVDLTESPSETEQSGSSQERDLISPLSLAKVDREFDAQFDAAWGHYWETEGLKEVQELYNDIPDYEWLEDSDDSEAYLYGEYEGESNGESENPISPETPVVGKENKHEPEHHEPESESEPERKKMRTS